MPQDHQARQKAGQAQLRTALLHALLRDLRRREAPLRLPGGRTSCTAATARQCCSGICDGTACAPVTTAAAPPVCPAVCPTCQICNAATGGVCAVDIRENGEPGPGCAEPNVCCGGTCCTSRPTGVRECNAAGTCASCAEVCPETCHACVNLVNGETLCTDALTTQFSPCTARQPLCPDGFPFCVESYTRRADNVTVTGACGPVPPGTGCCMGLTRC